MVALVGSDVDARWPKSIRLRRRPEFLRVNRGRRLTTRNLVVRASPGTGEQARFGLAVSKKVGNAVVRNRVKRWLREALRREHHGLPVLDVVFIARPSAATAGYLALRGQVAEVLDRLGRLQ